MRWCRLVLGDFQSYVVEHADCAVVLGEPKEAATAVRAFPCGPGLRLRASRLKEECTLSHSRGKEEWHCASVPGQSEC